MGQPIHLQSYDLTEVLASGTAGRVWAGVHRETGISVAVKVLHQRVFRRRGAVDDFFNEARVAASLNHPNIVRVIDYGRISDGDALMSPGTFAPGCPFLVAERAGQTLAKCKSSMDWPSLRILIQTVLDALAYAHARQIVHRDIKPGNILVDLDLDGKIEAVKLTDFGIAHLQERAIEGREELVGTPDYMAPEQIRLERRWFGPWTDLYALGCTVYEMLCGHKPFEHPDPHGVMAAHVMRPFPKVEPRFDAPDGIEQWIQRLTMKEPRRRFQFAADAMRALEELEQPKLAAPMNTPRIFAALFPEDEPTVILDAVKTLQPGRMVTLNAIDLPRRWVRGEPPPVPMEMVGAGLRLFPLREVPIVGRTHTRDALWQSLYNVYRGGEPQLVVLRGPAGLGKSRLAQWLCRRAHELGAAVPMRATHSRERGKAHGLGPMLERFFRGVGMRREGLQEHLEQELRALGASMEHEWVVLTDWIRPRAELGRALQTQQERFNILKRLLWLMGQRRPVILWLDDLQWGEQALRFVGSLLREPWLRPCPVLMIATVRQEVQLQEIRNRRHLEELLTHPRAQALTLEPLTEADHRSLLRRALRLEDRLNERILARTAGNPLFAIQLIHNWVQRGVLRATPEGFVLDEDDDQPWLPDDLFEFWSRQLSRLMANHRSEQRMLEIGAVFGQRIPLEHWRRACELRQVHFAPRLIELLQTAGWILAEPDGYHFVHGMLQETIARLAREAGRWKEHCLAVAAALEPEATTGQEHERLAELFLQGDAFRPAVVHMELAEGFYARSSAPRSRSRVLFNLQHTLASMGLAEHSNARLLVRVKMAVCNVELQRIEDLEVEFAALQAAINAGSPGPRVRLHFAFLEFRLAEDQGHLVRAESLLERGTALADELSEGYWQVRMRSLRAQVLPRLGRVRPAIDLLQQAEAIVQDRDDIDLSAAATARLVLSSLYAYLGAWEEARQRLETALDELKRCGHWALHNFGMTLMGDVLRLGSGDFDGAERCYSNVLKYTERTRPGMDIVSRLNLSYVAIAREEYAAALERLDTLTIEIHRTGKRVHACWVDTARMVCCAGLGDWGRLDEIFEKIQEPLLQIRDRDLAWMLTRCVKLALLGKQPQRAQLIEPMAIEQWETLEQPDEIQRIKHWMAQHTVEPTRA